MTGVVKFVEQGGERQRVTCDACRVIVLGGFHNFAGVGGEVAHQFDFFRSVQLSQLCVCTVAQVGSLCCHGFKQAADTRICVLNIVNRILAVLLNSEVKVKVHFRVWFPQIEQETCGIHRHFFQQGYKRNCFAAALAGFDDFTVTNQANHLHQEYVQIGRVDSQRLQGAFQTRHIAMMVGTQHIDRFVKFAHHQFVIMVCNIRHNISRHAVCTHQNKIFGAVVFTLKPECAVLFIGCALFFQQRNHALHCAVFVQGRFPEPVVVFNAVFQQVVLQPLNVQRQRIADQRFAAFRFRRVNIFVTVDFSKFFGMRGNVGTLVTILRERNRVLSLVNLQVAYFQGHAEFIDLIACVIDVELALYFVACRVQYRSEAVADCTAAGVADVHRAGGVGGNELHQHALAAAEVAAAIGFAAVVHVTQNSSVKLGFVEEIQEAGACNFTAVKKRAVQ